MIEKPSPFVKWAGGKRQLVDELKDNLPSNFNNYFEPFVGAGALLFDLTPEHATISDLNEELINVYRCIKSKTNFPKLLKLLDEHEQKHSEDHYIKTRDIDRSEDYQEKTIYEKAARSIYLNKTCFNGLYRVNSAGYFNVPSSKKKTIKTYDMDNMKILHKYLNKKHVKIKNADFEKAVKEAQEGDFVYFDPPYDQIGNQSFVSYTKYSFSKDDQLRLFNVFTDLTNKGVYVMLSNSDTQFIKELYKNFKIVTVEAWRLINSKKDGRNKVKEVIITNY